MINTLLAQKLHQVAIVCAAACFGLATPAVHAAETSADAGIVTPDEPDDDLYGETLWRGFDHEPEGPFAPTAHERAIHDRLRSDPAYQMDHQILVIAPDGRGAAYCGIWHLPGTNYAIVEPVATAPEHRRKGLARAAIHEATRRVAAQGATEIRPVGAGPSSPSSATWSSGGSIPSRMKAAAITAAATER